MSYLWMHQFLGKDLLGTDNEKIKIINPGQYNTDSGPDFTNARIKIGNTVWAGNVEVHIKSSDWYQHGHHLDLAYDNIILHVVYNNDKPALRLSAEEIPTLELMHLIDSNQYERYKSLQLSKHRIACESLLFEPPYFDTIRWMEQLMLERLQSKMMAIKHELGNSMEDFRETLYRKLCRSFGFKTNADAFELLARTLPLKLLDKHKNNLLQLEALLFGQAGLLKGPFRDDYPKKLRQEYQFLQHKYQLEPLERKIFKFMRMRPANFPSIRLSQLARLLYQSDTLIHEILLLNSLEDVTGVFEVSASEYWNRHYRFDKFTRDNSEKKLGFGSIQLIIINTIIPFLFTYGVLQKNEENRDKAFQWLRQMKAETNSICKGFKKLGINAKNALQSQALIHLKTTYCDQKRCLECHFGHHIIRS